MTRLVQMKPLSLALLGVCLVLGVFYLEDPRFFFLNDRQVQYFPYGMIIRDALLHGQWPFVTIRTFFGGALWLDPQYGLYNPLSLIVDFLINPRSLELSSFEMSLLLNLLLAASTYALGRSYGLARDYAALFALLMGGNIFVLNFYSNMWQPALVSTIWSIFAWAVLKRLSITTGPGAQRVLLAAVMIFLTVSGGWPHQYVALAAIIAVLFADAWSAGNRKGAVRLIYASLLGAIFSLPVLAPMMAASAFWSRNEGFYNNGVLSPDLGDLLNFSNPIWLPHFKDFFLKTASAPLFFVAWFALPLLAGGPGWRISRDELRKWREVPVLLVIFTLLVLSAQEMGPLRWPSRWLVDVDIAFLLMLLLFVQRSGMADRPFRPELALGALLVTTLAALFENPASVVEGIVPLLLCALFICALPLARRFNLALYLGVTSIIIAMTIGIGFAGGTAFLDHGKRDQAEAAATADDGSNGYALFWGLKKNIADLPDEKLFLEGASGAYYNLNTINGYSSLQHNGLEGIFPGIQQFPDLSSLETLRLPRHEPETGAPYLDLLKIRKVTAAESLAPREADFPAGWRRSESAAQYLFGRRKGAGLAFGSERIVSFERKEPFRLPGTISWHSPAMTLEPRTVGGADGENFDIINGGRPGLLVFARLYYPGYKATLDGKSLTVRSLDHMLVAVEVPPQAHGHLTLNFMPPFLKECLALVALALLVWSIAAVAERRHLANNGEEP